MRAISLIELILEGGLSTEERALLDEVVRRGEVAREFEEAAFQLVPGHIPRDAGAQPAEVEANQALAIQLLHGDEYHQLRASLLEPLNQLLGLMEARTGPELAAQIGRVRLLQMAVMGVVIALFGGMVVAWRGTLSKVLRPIERLRWQSSQVGEELSRLSRATVALAAGAMEGAHKVSTPPMNSRVADEIGDLSREHDGMLTAMTAASEAITSIVEDLGRHSRELEAANGELVVNRRRLEIILNSVADGIHGLSKEGRIIFENAASIQMFGAEKEGLEGRPGHATIHHTRASGEPYPVEECPIYTTLRDGKTRSVAGEVFWRQDGTSFPVEYMATAIRSEMGEIEGVVVVFRDLSERALQERSLRASERRFRCLVSATAQIVWWTDAEGMVRGPLETWQAYTGQSEEEVLGHGWVKALHPDDKDRALAV